MYEAFYKLAGKPFQLNPDPQFFFHSKGHKRALAYMRYGLQQGQGFIIVTGDVGTGKTMLVNNLFGELEAQSIVAAKIVSSNLKDVDLLRLIAAEFDIPFERSSKATILNKLEAFFIARKAEGKRILLVVDEAQNLPHSALEELRMLSNFDYQGAPLVQSFLLGQREFRSVLRGPGLEQLRQRVIAAYHLTPLSATEVQAYIEHRLRKVRWDGDPAIENGVYEKVFELTAGVPRRINTLFDRVLLSCFLDESHAISLDVIRMVWAEIEFERLDGDSEFNALYSGAAQPASPFVAPVVTQSLSEMNRVQQLEARLDNIQELLSVLAERQSEGLRQPTAVQLNTMAPNLDGTSNKFPLWTTTFLSLLCVVSLIIISVGFWLMKTS